MLFIKGKIYFTHHSIDRYKDRVLKHKQIDAAHVETKQVKKMIIGDLQSKYIKEVVDIDNMKFIFTHNHYEFRFERTEDNKGWLLLTIIRYKRMLPNQEPLLEDYLKNTYQESGIRTAIALRKRQKERFNDDQNVVRNLGRD